MKLQDSIQFSVHQSVIIIWPSILTSVPVSCESLFVHKFADLMPIRNATYEHKSFRAAEYNTDRVCKFEGEAACLLSKAKEM
jgi:hypothetical protein